MLGLSVLTKGLQSVGYLILKPCKIWDFLAFWHSNKNTWAFWVLIFRPGFIQTWIHRWHWRKWIETLNRTCPFLPLLLFTYCCSSASVPECAMASLSQFADSWSIQVAQITWETLGFLLVPGTSLAFLCTSKTTQSCCLISEANGGLACLILRSPDKMQSW